jgi:hypothetical protein
MWQQLLLLYMRQPSGPIEMAKTSRLLEVRLIALKPDQWEWQVCLGDTPIMTGYATSRETAQIDGDSALFLLLSAG